MRVTRLLARGRRLAKKTLPGECIIRRGGGEPVLDDKGEPILNEETAEYEVTEPETVYSGPCDLSFDSSVVREIDVQGQPGVEQEPVLELPVLESAGVQVNDVAEITAHRFDAGIVGRKVRIAGLHGGTVTLRRLPVEVSS